jgi:C-methyltransferase
MTVTRAYLDDMMRAYKRTSLLRAGVELGVFDALANGGTVADVAGRLDASPRGTRILLDALVAIDLVEPAGEGYRLAPGAAELLTSTSPTYYGDMVRVVASDWEWDALCRFADAVRQGGTVAPRNAETPDFEYWTTFASYASAVTVPTASVLADSLAPWADPAPELDVLDVACGHGIYGLTLLRRFPQARVTDLDWESVLAVAEKHAVEQGLRDRVRFLPGDMFTVPYGGPYDLVTVTNVMHHFAPERGVDLLRRAAAALRPGGRVGVVSLVREGDAAEDRNSALFSVLMLAWTELGEVHDLATHVAMLTDAGFVDAEVFPVPGLPFRVLLARRPD